MVTNLSQFILPMFYELDHDPKLVTNLACEATSVTLTPITGDHPCMLTEFGRL